MFVGRYLLPWSIAAAEAADGPVMPLKRPKAVRPLKRLLPARVFAAEAATDSVADTTDPHALMLVECKTRRVGKARRREMEGNVIDGFAGQRNGLEWKSQGSRT